MGNGLMVQKPLPATVAYLTLVQQLDIHDFCSHLGWICLETLR